MDAQIEIGGTRTDLTFHSCVAHEHGEFRGNVDLVVESADIEKEDLLQATLEHLRVRPPGGGAALDLLGYARKDRRLELTFHGTDPEDTPAPDTVEIIWQTGPEEKSLGRVSCEPAGDPLIEDEIRSGFDLRPKTPGGKKTQEAANRFLAGLIGLFLTGALLWAASCLGRQAAEGFLAYTWPEARGAIVRAEIEEERSPGNAYDAHEGRWRDRASVTQKLRLEIAFYLAGESDPGTGETGTEYRTRRYNAASDSGLNVPSAAAAELRDVQAMQPLTVRYPPSDPHRALVRPGLPIETAYLCQPLPALLALVLACWFRAFGCSWDGLSARTRRYGLAFLLWSLALVLGLLLTPLLIFAWLKLLGSSPCGSIVFLYALAAGILCWKLSGKPGAAPSAS